MTQSALRASVLSLLGLFVVPASSFSQEEGVTAAPVVIRMYDMTTSAPALRAEAMRTASAIVRDAGVRLKWADCSRAGADHPCHTVPGTRELVVRIMPKPGAGANRSRDALSIRGHSGGVDEHLGFAAVGDASRAGILATVYFESVEAAARRGGIDTSTLLGRAIAHEVGHLLMPGAGHSSNGLMRAPWAYEELMADRREDWLFSSRDRRHLRAALSK
jgi:hypothetical protein